MKPVFFWLRCLATMIALAPGLSSAQTTDFPNRPVRLVLGYPPAGSVDILARALANQLSILWKQNVIVENRPGATEFIAAEYVAKSPSDGYTLFVATEIGLEVNPLLYSKMPYDPKRDFVPVTRVLDGPMMFAVNPNLPVKNMKEFIAYAKANPGKVNYGSSGNGGQIHLAMAYLAKASGVQLTHIPYKGTLLAVQDMMSGVVQATVAPVSVLGPFVHSGRVRPLGVAGDRRVKLVPDVLTLKEQGYPELDANWALYIVAPTGTPLELRNKIAADFRTVIREPKFEQDQFDKFGYTAVADTPAQFAEYLTLNAPKQAARVQAADVKMD